MDEAVICRMAPEEVDKWWPKVAAFVSSAIDKSQGEMSAAGVRQALKSGDMQMWLVAEMGEEGKVSFTAGCVTQIVAYEGHLNLRIAMIGGKGMDKWGGKLLRHIESFAREFGCRAIEAVGRKGLERKISTYGFRPVYVVYLKEVEADENVEDGRNNGTNKSDFVAA